MKFINKRKIDELGRIVLPIELRSFYNLYAGDTLAIKTTASEIILCKATEGTETERHIDELGRILIPKVITNKFKLKAGDDLAILPCEDEIHLYPADSPNISIDNSKHH